MKNIIFLFFIKFYSKIIKINNYLLLYILLLNIRLKLVKFDTFQFSNGLISLNDEHP